MQVALLGAVLVAVAFLGPRQRFEDEWVEPELPSDLVAFLSSAEAAVPRLRAEAQREIVWADAADRTRTPLALVYLHGFSADRHEVEPLVSELATEIGANVYFARLRGHGRDGGAMAEATVEDWLRDTAEAVAIGGRIGERVVVIGTSTGGTLAVWAAARAGADSRLSGVIAISPNFQPKDRSSRLLLYPWGGVIARAVVGPERCFEPANEAQALHWTTCYPTSALLPMMALVEHVRTMDLGGIEVPALLVFSTRDGVVDPAETERLLSVLPRAEAFRYNGAEDPQSHVLAGDILSPAATDVVRVRALQFLDTLPTEARR